MFNIGDELTVGSYRIPWLIWIQLIVMLLLLALLFFFAVFPLDPDDGGATVSVAVTATATASTSAKGFLCDEIQMIDKPLTNHDSTATVSTNRQRHPQVSVTHFFSLSYQLYSFNWDYPFFFISLISSTRRNPSIWPHIAYFYFLLLLFCVFFFWEILSINLLFHRRLGKRYQLLSCFFFISTMFYPSKSF